MCISTQTVHAVAIRGRRNRQGHVDRAGVPGSRSREPQQPIGPPGARALPSHVAFGVEKSARRSMSLPGPSPLHQARGLAAKEGSSGAAQKDGAALQGRHRHVGRPRRGCGGASSGSDRPSRVGPRMGTGRTVRTARSLRRVGPAGRRRQGTGSAVVWEAPGQPFDEAGEDLWRAGTACASPTPTGCRCRPERGLKRRHRDRAKASRRRSKTHRPGSRTAPPDYGSMWSNARRELEDVGNGARRVHTERVSP